MIGRLSTSETIQAYLRAVGCSGCMPVARNSLSANRHYLEFRENTCGADGVAAPLPLGAPQGLPSC